MKNLVRTTLRGSGSVTIPAGITSVTIYTKPPKLTKCNAQANHCVALKDDGSAWCWGLNSSGELGNNSTSGTSSPVAVTGNHIFVEVFAGQACTYGRKADGSVWSWGSGLSGQLGNNTTSNFSSPVAVVGGHQFIQICDGHGHVTALKTDGSVWSWGSNPQGELGDGTTTDRSSPVALIGGHVFVQVGSGSETGFGLKADGTIWAWGLNNGGQLGNNTSGLPSNTSSPVQVAGGGGYVEIGDVARARKADGTVWCWGDNSQGSLGNNSLTNTSSPVQVAGPHVFVGLGRGPQSDLSFARKADGSVWAWGGGDGAGEIGDGANSERSSPVQVIGGYQFIEVSQGSAHACARRADGTIFCWGIGTSGELGNNTQTSVSSPVQVVGQNFARMTFDSDPDVFKETIIAVTPGSTVSYATGASGFFGITSLGAGVRELILEYVT